MQFKALEKQGPFASVFYTLTWPIGWEHMLSFAQALIEADFGKKPDSIRCQVSSLGTSQKDVTAQLQAADYKPQEAAFAQTEMGVLTLEGYSAIMETAMRLTLYNQTDRCLLQVLGLEGLDKHGEHCYDKFMDSVELMGHLHHQKRQYAGAWIPGGNV